MSAVWDRTTEFLSDNQAAAAAVALPMIFVPVSLSGTLAPLKDGAGPGVRGLIEVIGLVLALVSLWGQASVTALAIEPAAGTRPATRLALRRMPQLIALSLVAIVAVAVLLAPSAIAMTLHGADFAAIGGGDTASVPSGAGTTIALNMIVAVPLLLWLGARLALLVPVVIAERRGLGTFARSFALTRGAAMKIIGVLILYAIVSLIAVFAARAAAGSIFALIVGRGDEAWIATVLTAFVAGAVSAGFSVVAAAFTGRLYLALRGADPAVPAG